MDLKPADLRILAFFAHPDDETMFLGGTLAYLADRGAEIHFLCATRGEGGESGNPPVCPPDELGNVRQAELECAVNVLGGTDLEFLDYIDPPVGENGELYPFTDDLEGLVKDLESVLYSIQPQVILTHGPAGEYGHPAHVQASEGIARAVGSLNDVPLQIYAPCWLSRETGNFEPEPDILLDISPWWEVKIEAALCHKTQHDLFVRHGSARAGRQVTVPEMIRGKEALIELQHQGMNSDIDLIAYLLSKIAIPKSEW